MRSVYWQLGILGTISAFAFRHRETKKNLCQDGRSQDLPNTGTFRILSHVPVMFVVFQKYKMLK